MELQCTIFDWCVCVCDAGLVKRDQIRVLSPSEKAAVASVFSRLDGKSDISPSSAAKHYSSTHTTSPSSSTTPNSAPLKRTIVTASPSPKKLSLRVTSKAGSRSAAVKTGGGTKRESSGGLVSSSSSFSSKEPIKHRLGNRTSDHGTSSRGGDVTVTWPETVSASIAAISSSGRVSARLGGARRIHRESAPASRKTRPTMVADSASNPQPKVATRLGSTPKTSQSASGGSSSRLRVSSRQSKPTSSSMVADEYELKRQMDIRSRLNEKEKEVKERRSGPLSGRLGQHRVFQRLT